MSIDTLNTTAGRESSGRFARGNPGGPGNPHVRKSAMMREAIAKAVSVEDLEKVFRALITKAQAGDREAIRLVLYYTIGKPHEFQAALKADLAAGLTWEEEPSSPPPAAGPPGGVVRRDDPLVVRRGEREMSVEEMLGITPPTVSNGANGPAAPAALPSVFGTSSAGGGRAEASRSTRK